MATDNSRVLNGSAGADWSKEEALPTFPAEASQRLSLHTLTSRQAASDLALVHTVRSHDTISSLSLEYGIHQNALRRANKLHIQDTLYTKKDLLIPLSACVLLPSKQVFEKAEVTADTIEIFWRPLSARVSASDSSMPSLIAARLDNWHHSPTPSENGYSSRSASFDLMRMEGPSLSRVNLNSVSKQPGDLVLERFLSSTNNIYGNAEVQQEDCCPVPISKASLDRDPVPSQCDPAPLKMQRMVLPLVHLPSNTTGKTALHAQRPALNSSSSFRLTAALSSAVLPSQEPARKRVASRSASSLPSTKSSPETLLMHSPTSASKLKSKLPFGRSGWEALEEERIMAEALVRQIAAKRNRAMFK